MDNHVFVYKAKPFVDEETELEVHICKELPGNLSLGQQDAMFLAHAKMLNKALLQSLPGGLYDLLICEMLRTKTSHFIVRHQEAYHAA